MQHSNQPRFLVDCQPYKQKIDIYQVYLYSKQSVNITKKENSKKKKCNNPINPDFLLIASNVIPSGLEGVGPTAPMAPPQPGCPLALPGPPASGTPFIPGGLGCKEEQQY